MIKIQNNIATREPIPAFLVGLKPESLADLSWTDPALGVSDCAWWPEVDQSPALAQYEKYGDETLTIDTANKQVLVTRAVVPFSQEEIDAVSAEQAASVRAQRNSLLSQSDWTQVADAPVDKAVWATYRQELRDVTAQTGFPFEVIWPVAP